MAARRGDANSARKLCWACNGAERRGALLEAELSAREAGHDVLAEELVRFHASAVESPDSFDAPCSLTVDSLISVSVVCDQGERDSRLLRYLLNAPSFTSEDAGRALVRAAGAGSYESLLMLLGSGKLPGGSPPAVLEALEHAVIALSCRRG